MLYALLVDLFAPSNLGIGMLVAIVVMSAVEWSIRRKRIAHRELVRRYAQGVGIVTKVVVAETFESGTAYTPVIEYTLPDGQRYAMNGETSGFPEVEVGSEVRIAYDPALPSSAVLVEPPSWNRQLGFGDVLAFVLITVIVTAIVGFVRH